MSQLLFPTAAEEELKWCLPSEGTPNDAHVRIWFRRDVTDLLESTADDSASSYIDLEDGQVDEDAQESLKKLRYEIGHIVDILSWCTVLNSLRPRLNKRPLADDIFKCIFENKNEWILRKISLKFVPKVRINNIPALVQIMAWCRPGDKPLSEPMMVSLVTHICVTRPQWIKTSHCNSFDMKPTETWLYDWVPV